MMDLSCKSAEKSEVTSNDDVPAVIKALRAVQNAKTEYAADDIRLATALDECAELLKAYEVHLLEAANMKAQAKAIRAEYYRVHGGELGGNEDAVAAVAMVKLARDPDATRRDLRFLVATISLSAMFVYSAISLPHDFAQYQHTKQAIESENWKETQGSIYFSGSADGETAVRYGYSCTGELKNAPGKSDVVRVDGNTPSGLKTSDLNTYTVNSFHPIYYNFTPDHTLQTVLEKPKPHRTPPELALILVHGFLLFLALSWYFLLFLKFRYGYAFLDRWMDALVREG
jgi:hypothetical protein